MNAQMIARTFEVLLGIVALWLLTELACFDEEPLKPVRRPDPIRFRAPVVRQSERVVSSRVH